MKKLLLGAGMLVLTMFGCGESIDSPDAHICGHFYQGVGDSSAQVLLSIENQQNVTLDQEHQLYAITYSSELTEGKFTVPVTMALSEEGHLYVATSNVEDDFAIFYGGSEQKLGVLNDKCDVAVYDMGEVTAGELTFTMHTSRPGVLLLFEVR